jgi:hypothetical protein
MMNLPSVASTSRGNGGDVWEGSMSVSDTTGEELWGDGIKVKSALESDNGTGVLPYRRDSLRKFPLNVQTMESTEPRQGKLISQQPSDG